MTSPATAARAVLASVALACGTAALAACGSGGGPAAASSGTTTTATAAPSGGTGGTGGTPAPPATGSTSSPPAAGPAGCATSGLAVKLGPGNGAAGSTYFPIQFTNTSGAACSLFGYPGVSFVTGTNGSQIGLAARRDSTQPAQNIVLAPKAAAHATLRIVDALNFTVASCHLTTAHALKIFPPGQTAALFISFTSKTCASSSPSDQVLFIQTISPGASG